MYRYKVVPFIGQIRRKVFNTDTAQTVSTQLQSIIDEHVQEGWEFYSIEKVEIHMEPGCLFTLFGMKEAFIPFDQIIFRRDE